MRDKLEAALVSYLQSQGVTVPVHPGFSTADKTGLCVVASVRSAEMEDYPSGNLSVECAVEVRGPAGASGYNDLCDLVWRTLAETNLGGLLTLEAEELVVHGFTAFPRQEWEIDEDAHVTRYLFAVYVSPSALT